MTRRMKAVTLLVATISLLTAVSHAQERWWRLAPRMATAESFDGTFNFCRVMYRSDRFGGGGGWRTDAMTH